MEKANQEQALREAHQVLAQAKVVGDSLQMRRVILALDKIALVHDAIFREVNPAPPSNPPENAP